MEVLIAGSSMRPTLQIGDTVRVDPSLRARCGDVIVFRSPPTPLCHRVIAVIPWWPERRLVHRGDAPGAGIGVLSPSAVIGRATHARSPGSDTWRRLGRRLRAPLHPRVLLEYVRYWRSARSRRQAAPSR